MGLTDDLAAIARRYDRLAPIYPLMDPAFLMPPGLRRRAVATLDLHHGDRVLEVGCGSGRNLGLLLDGVGPDGAVVGVDLSPGMLRRAERRAARRRIVNVELRLEDAAGMGAGPSFDAALFSLSYTVMPNRHTALAGVWARLRPGGRLTIFDAGSHGRAGRLLEVPSRWLSRMTVLGEPTIRPWEELASHDPHVATSFHGGGTYVIATARKPAGDG